MRLLKYTDKTWHQDYYFMFNCTHAKMIRHIKKVKGLDLDEERLHGKSAGACYAIEEEHSDVYLIWTSITPVNAEGLSILAHECLHAVNQSLSVRGYKYDVNNDEPLTYAFGALFRNALELYLKSKRKK